MINFEKIKREKITRQKLIDIFYNETGELIDFYIDETKREIKIWFNCFIVIKDKNNSYLEFELDIFDTNLSFLNNINDFKETVEKTRIIENVLIKHKILKIKENRNE